MDAALRALERAQTTAHGDVTDDADDGVRVTSTSATGRRGNARDDARELMRACDALTTTYRARLTRSALGARVLACIERGSRAALDVGRIDVAERACEVLDEACAPTSSRRAAARAATLEAQGDVTQAESIYKDVLKENECDVRARKGLIACARSKGATEEARNALIAYVETFGADADAWYELGHIYAESGAYDECLFCYEEVLLAMPHSADAHRRMAEVLYTMGGETRVREAKNHFAAALDFTTGKDARALYGVVLCAKALRRMKASKKDTKSDTKSDDDGAALADAAAERLLQRYAVEHEALLAIVRPQLRGALA